MDKKRMIWIYKTMNQIRRFEEKAVQLFEDDILRGSVHLYIGEEAVAATICSNLGDEDYIASTHRGHGHCIAKGATLDMAMAELMGKATGCCRGRGGSMHIADIAKGNLGANAIVGGGIPIASGSALALKLMNKKNVTVAFFGDGASNQGTFHESINMASNWKLPVIFVCENNGFGISTPVEQSTSVADISVRGVSYNIPGVTVDGNDVLAIDEAFCAAQKRALTGEGPTLIECKTYRWKGHWTGDPEVYRSREMVTAWMEKCPIKRFRKYLLEQKFFSKEELDIIEQEAIDEANRAAEFAINSPLPDADHVMDDVFVS